MNREVLILLQLCVAGICTPAEEARLEEVFETCRPVKGPLLACMTGQPQRPVITFPAPKRRARE